MQLRFFAIALGVGVFAELAAYLLGLWKYRAAWTPVLNIVVMYGLIMGGLAAALRWIGTAPTFLLAACLGLTYEIVNLAFLDWWEFKEPQPSGTRRVGVLLILAVLWGIVPLATFEAQAALRRWATPPAGSPLEQIKERESALVQKLDSLRGKAREVESNLEAVRQRKQRLLERQGKSIDTPQRPAS